jgi:hypothetical protein
MPWFEPWYNRYAAIVLSAAAGLGGYEWIHWKDLSPSDWGTWIGSIGTVATLVGTIWLATADARQRRHESRLLALLHASGMYWKLVYIHATVASAVKDLRAAGVDKVIRQRTLTEQDLNETALWTMEDLVPLVPVDGKLVANLAQAADRITLAKSYMLRMRHMNDDEHMKFVPIAADMLDSAATLIDAAKAECMKATHALNLQLS